jgi:alginate O-acetyltransferase complex protein AlgI
MVFSSIPFLFFFLPIFLLLYFIVPYKYKNIILLIFSLIFYAWGEPIYILLMVFSSIVDYFNGLMIYKNKDNPKKKKMFLIFSIMINLSLLGFFKYIDFIIKNINNIFNVYIPLLRLGLPIGISFYTFQTMSYSIDVYRGNVKPEKKFLNFMAYVSMFPQLIAGPIVRYETIAKELDKREINFNKFSEGFLRFLRGIFKKVLIANNVGYLFSLITSMPINEVSQLLGILAVIAFTFQIYFDFSGYSDMAIGMGKMLGFTYLENFNYPYIATSITDFWRRWHISLSSFFKDYVYIPLGGSRVSKILNIRNIFVVWLLTGIWHGAEWNFILWGIYYGVILLIEKFILKDIIEKFPKWLKHVYTLIFVLIGWIIFAFDDMTILKDYFKIILGINTKFIDTNFLFYFKNYFIILLIATIFSMPVYKIIEDKIFSIKNKFIGNTIIIVSYLVLFIISLSYLVADTYNPFLYFRF